MPEEEYRFLPSSRLMQVNEIEGLSRIFVSLGVNKIRLTGGEPLVRKDVGEIISSLSKLPVSLTLTTNGTRLDEYLPVLTGAGIKSLNISLDTLDREKFNLITKRNQFQKVWDNIHAAIDHGIHVKVNVVVMKGINDNEINDFVAWTKLTPVHVRFIEFMPFTGNHWSNNKLVTLQEILTTIEGRFSVIKLKDELNDTTKKYIVPGHQGTFAVISTMSQPFCSTCNRIRLTADGKIKNCLFSKEEIDLLTSFREGKDVEDLIRQTIWKKAYSHGGQFETNFNELDADAIENRSMIGIGG
jgi:GTP 3',8-cyclase